MYDLIIRNGTVVDGSGLAGYRADVAVMGDRVARIGRILERGVRELDADGRVVTPGFIDGHTHMDAQIFWDPLGRSSCWHGVTTVVMGNCGFTLAPVRSDARELVLANLERAEDISAAAMKTGIDWQWEDFSTFLAVVDALPKGINYAANVGHSALRTYVMGERAFTESATLDELAAMVAELRRALRAGAVGFSSSRSAAHETSDDRPVASRAASWTEIEHLVGAMGALGQGIFETALEGLNSPVDLDERADFYTRMCDLAVTTGVPITFGVLPMARPGPTLLDLITRTTRAGGRMFGQSNSRGISLLSSFRSRLPFDSLPEWRELRAQPLGEQRRLLVDPLIRSRLVTAEHQGDYGRAVGAETKRPNFETLRVMDGPLPPYPTVAEMARRRGVDPVELMIDLSLASDFHQFFVQSPPGVEPSDILAILRHPRTVMTFSDSGAHVSQMSDASIQTHFLAYWVRDRQEFTLEEAVRMLTLAPAVAWGLSDRGLLREGMAADINIFDPATVGPEMPHVVADLPGGERRIEQTASGFSATVVRGTVLIENGAATGDWPGRLLRGGAGVPGIGR